MDRTIKEREGGGINKAKKWKKIERGRERKLRVQISKREEIKAV